MQSFYKYWGKARASSDSESAYHLLVYHSLDVAAVGWIYLEKNKQFLNFFAEKMRMEHEAVQRWACFWLSIHDLGKFSGVFQFQRSDIVQCLNNQTSTNIHYTERHDSLGYWFFRDHWQDLISSEDLDVFDSIDPWVRAVTGHHGLPPKSQGPGARSNAFYRDSDRSSAKEFFQVMHRFFFEDKINWDDFISNPSFQDSGRNLSWWVAGFTVLADWIGSNTDYFPYLTESVELTIYWERAKDKAEKALNNTGVLAQEVELSKSFEDFFPHIRDSSPLQTWATTVDIQPYPQIHILEDVTGAGKTEAAMMLAYRIMASGIADGFFIGLPTMATANAMYNRISDFYFQIFNGDPNLVLAHGSNEFVERFAASVIHSQKIQDNDDKQADETATARCIAWLADHNKRALLAQAGVGTIDQVLLSVLHSKHQSLRLLGLFRKVLIVDEVHACDSYMQRILESVLEFHARAGGSVILLSATLTKSMKRKLIRSYSRGCSSRGLNECSKAAYPLVTTWSSLGYELLEEPIESRSQVEREVHLIYEHEYEKILDDIKQIIDQGKCVCWIRNTISDAVVAYNWLSRMISVEKIMLFHSRFALDDRLQIESEVLRNFGKNSQHQERKGKVLIATQVVEQSLDVDFDFLISDLAPVDRLIQRAGRLQRHIRDKNGNRIQTEFARDERGGARMLVYGPEWTDNPSDGWFKAAFPKAAFVYKNHAQLWLTASFVRSGKWGVPHMCRDLIEGVFGADANIPPGLQFNADQAEGEVWAGVAVANNSTLNFNGGYSRMDGFDWWSDAKAPSRLGEQTINVILAKFEGGKIKPWSDREGKAGWAYSSLKVSARLMASAQFDDGSEIYREALALLPDKGKWSILLPLRANGDYWYGVGQSENRQNVEWQYDKKQGLLLNLSNVNIEDI